MSEKVWTIPEELRYIRDISAGARLLYGELLYRKENDKTYIKNAEICELFSVSPRTTTSWIAQLANQGLIESVVTNRDNRVVVFLDKKPKLIQRPVKKTITQEEREQQEAIIEKDLESICSGDS